MYGKNNPSPKKSLIIEGLKMGKNFSDLAADLSITKATAEVYGIDGLAAGQQIDHETLARLLDVSMDCFKRIRNKIVCEVYVKTENCVRYVIICRKSLATIKFVLY